MFLEKAYGKGTITAACSVIGLAVVFSGEKLFLEYRNGT